MAVTLLKPIGVRGGEADPEGSVPVAGLDFETVALRIDRTVGVEQRGADAGGRPFPRLEHHVPGSAFGVERLHEEELEFRSGRIAVAPGVHSPPEHARVVVDQGVAGVEVVENRWKRVDFTGAGDAVEDQHAGAVAPGGGMLCDQFLREMIIE